MLSCRNVMKGKMGEGGKKRGHADKKKTPAVEPIYRGGWK